MNTDSIIVSYSGGKDSLATLDICCRKYKTVKAFWLYWVRGLRFQEVVVESMQRRYGIEILPIPHFELPMLLGDQMLTFDRPSYPEYRVVKMREIHDMVRSRFGIPWIATGEKMTDSFTRRFMMRAVGSEWDRTRGIYYPLANWTDKQVLLYLRLRHIPLPPEYFWEKDSWGSMRGEGLSIIAKHFPDDYKKITAVFPFADALRRSHELYRSHIRIKAKNKAPAVRDANDPAE